MSQFNRESVSNTNQKESNYLSYFMHDLECNLGHLQGINFLLPFFALCMKHSLPTRPTFSICCASHMGKIISNGGYSQLSAPD